MAKAAAKKHIDHSYTSEIVCPHCGYKFSDSWEVESNEVECGECEKKFEVERHDERTYSTCEIPPEKKPPAPYDLSEPVVLPSGRTGAVTARDSEVHAKEEPRREEGDVELLRAVLAHFVVRGFVLRQEPHTRKHYPTIANFHWEGHRGDLWVKIGGYFGADAKFFFREDGRYYSNVLEERMPTAMKLECLAEMTRLVRLFRSFGYKFEGDPEPRVLALAVRDAALGREAQPKDALSWFRKHWGPRRDSVDERGFMALSPQHPRLDRDGVGIEIGATRYFYDWSGRLRMGVVYAPAPNNQWLLGHGENFWEIQPKKLFADPEGAPRRFVARQGERLRSELEKSLRNNNYQRVRVLAGLLERRAAP